MRIIIKIVLSVAAVLLLLNVVIIATGHSYLYKGIANTYLKGRKGPDIDEFRIFENREVKSGAYQPIPLSAHYNSREIHGEHLAIMEEYQSVAFLVLRNDSILFEKYWEGYGEDSHSNSFSMAKTIVSVLTGIAIGEGRITSIDQKVSDFLPEFGYDDRLTVRHLLTMSAGIDFEENYSGPFAFPARAYYGDDLPGLVKKYRQIRNPGEVFDYQSGTTQVLGFVLEKATNTTLADYASEKLWRQIGAKNPAFWSLDRENGHEKAYCCYNSNARDFARLGLLYLHQGSWKGKQVVPPEYVRQSVTKAALKEKDGSPCERYGYSWWLTSHQGDEVFYARGILGQYVLVIPEKNMVIVRLGHRRYTLPGDLHPAEVGIFLDAGFSIAPEKE